MLLSDPGIGQLAMFSEVTQAWDGTAPGTGGSGPVALAEIPPGSGKAGLALTPPAWLAAACRPGDERKVAAMIPASASTPPATAYLRQRGRAWFAPAVPMTSGSGLLSGPNGNIPIT